MKKIKKYLVKLCFIILNKLLKPIDMYQSINILIATRIAPHVGFHTYRANVIVKSSEINSIVYSFTFPDDIYFDIRLEYLSTEDVLNCDFIGTSIQKLDFLCDVLNNFKRFLEINESEIKKYFIAYIQQLTNH